MYKINILCIVKEGGVKKCIVIFVNYDCFCIVDLDFYWVDGGCVINIVI